MEQTIQSVLNQTYSNFELLILNDGSTDNTEEIILNFCKQDSRIKYYKNEKNQGLSYSRNKLIKLSTGSFIVNTDGDDLNLSQKFENQINFFIANPNIHLLGTQMCLIDEKNKTYGNWSYPLLDSDIKLELKNACCVANPTCMFKREVFDKINGYDESLIVCEDWDFFVRASANFNFANLNTVELKYRIHNNNMSVFKLEKTVIYTLFARLNLPREVLNLNSKQLLSAYPVHSKVFTDIVFKIYLFWIGTYLGFNCNNTAHDIYLQAKENYFHFFTKKTKITFIKNTIKLFAKKGDVKAIIKISSKLFK